MVETNATCSRGPVVGTDVISACEWSMQNGGKAKANPELSTVKLFIRVVLFGCHLDICECWIWDWLKIGYPKSTGSTIIPIE